MKKPKMYLGVDTASVLSSCWLMTSEKLILQIGFSQRKAMECLPEAVERIRESAGVSLEECSGFVVNPGPGSLSGIKIGIAFQQTLATIFNKPLFAISGLDALAFSLLSFLPASRCLLVPVIAAVRSEIYFAFYRPSVPLPERISTYQRVHASSIPFPSHESCFLLGGNGIHLLPNVQSKSFHIVSHLFVPTPISFLAWLPKAKPTRSVQPIYLYPPPIHRRERVNTR